MGYTRRRIEILYRFYPWIRRNNWLAGPRGMWNCANLLWSFRYFWLVLIFLFVILFPVLMPLISKENFFIAQESLYFSVLFCWAFFLELFRLSLSWCGTEEDTEELVTTLLVIMLDVFKDCYAELCIGHAVSSIFCCVLSGQSMVSRILICSYIQFPGITELFFLFRCNCWRGAWRQWRQRRWWRWWRWLTGKCRTKARCKGIFRKPWGWTWWFSCPSGWTSTTTTSSSGSGNKWRRSGKC